MGKGNLIQLILGIIFMIGVAVMLYFLRRKEEKKVFGGYNKVKECDYLHMPRYRAVLETDTGYWGQTNLISAYIFEDEIVLNKEGIFAINYYTITFDSSNMILLRYKKISKFRTKLIMHHSEQGIYYPYNVLITSRIKDDGVEMLDKLCESIRNG